MITLFHIFMVLLVAIAVRAAPMLDPYNAGNDSSDAAIAMPPPMLREVVAGCAASLFRFDLTTHV